MKHPMTPYHLLLCLLLLGSGTTVARSADGATVHYSMEDAITLALDNNPTVRDARLRLKIAEGQVREAWASVFPRLTTSATYSRSLKLQEIFLPAIFFDSTASLDDQIPVQVGSDNNWRADIALQQPIFHMGAFIGVGAAGRVKQLQAEATRGTVQQVVNSVRQTYLNTLLTKEEERLTLKSLERIRKALEEARAMNESGMLSDYDVLRFEVQVSNLESSLHRTQTQLAAAKRDLLVTMGLDPGQDLTIAGELNRLNLDDPAGNDPANRELLNWTAYSIHEILSFDEAYHQASTFLPLFIQQVQFFCAFRYL